MLSTGSTLLLISSSLISHLSLDSSMLGLGLFLIDELHDCFLAFLFGDLSVLSGCALFSLHEQADVDFA